FRISPEVAGHKVKSSLRSSPRCANPTGISAGSARQPSGTSRRNVPLAGPETLLRISTSTCTLAFAPAGTTNVPDSTSTENLGVTARVGRCSTFLSSTYGAVTAVEIRLPGPPFAPPTSWGALLKIDKFNPPRLGTME